ncbi:MAG: VIT1/CCC1 transporter family protein [Candidatus Kerfeldbacteria bacterium]|nr:VIT1/CCC1 transporter family protein [Candidatus Kerfeldbacteria bacterium]
MNKQQHPRYIHHELNHHVSHTWRSKVLHSLREIIFGLQDGIVSTLGAITGIAGGVQDHRIVILSGCVVIVVESISMAAGTFLSSKSAREVDERMLWEEEQEIEKNPAGERAELVEFYRARGFLPEEIEIVVNRITSDKKLWLEEMAFKELRVIPQYDGTPKTDALFMGVSYVFGGLVPLVSYFFLPIATALPTSLFSSIAILFGIGYVKGRMVHVNRLRSGLEMMMISFTAAAFGYMVGQIAAHFFGI